MNDLKGFIIHWLLLLLLHLSALSPILKTLKENNFFSKYLLLKDYLTLEMQLCLENYFLTKKVKFFID